MEVFTTKFWLCSMVLAYHWERVHLIGQFGSWQVIMHADVNSGVLSPKVTDHIQTSRTILSSPPPPSQYSIAVCDPTHQRQTNTFRTRTQTVTRHQCQSSIYIMRECKLHRNAPWCTQYCILGLAGSEHNIHDMSICTCVSFLNMHNNNICL